MSKGYLTSQEICEEVIGVGIKKASNHWLNLLLLGIVAGAFIAFAAEGSNMAVHRLTGTDYGMGKALAGVIFATGLMLVIIAGGELFTGNNLMVAALLDGKISPGSMLWNWGIVYAGNLAGSLLIAWMMVSSGLFDTSAGLMGGYTIQVAAHKVELNFSQALILGVLCNWIVCLAVWMAYGAKDMTGKLLAIFFPISLFITSGFEHSVANMYYIPAGIMAKANEAWAQASGLSADKLGKLNWGAFVTRNLIPVTLGNMVGGCLLVAGIYWVVYKWNSKKNV